MDSEVDLTSSFIKEERENSSETEYPAYLSNSLSTRDNKQVPPRGVATFHYHPASSEQTAEQNETINETDSTHNTYTSAQKRQRLDLPRPSNSQKGFTVVQTSRLSSNVGDYLDFVFWIRSLLVKMYPTLSELPDDMPLFSGLKWTDRHAWGRNVDEKCPSYWRVCKII